jgi:AAA ATPase domain
MRTLGMRMERRDAALFSGRLGELERFDRLLYDSSGDERRVVLLHGPGGIGKSTLAREMARRARSTGASVWWIDGRELPPVPEALEDRIGGASAAERPMVVLDSYEQVAALGAHLRRAVLPDLPGTAIVLIVGREPPESEWAQGGWEALTTEIELGPLSDEEALEAARKLGVAAGDVGPLVTWSAGSPLALSLGARGLEGDPDWKPGRGAERQSVLPPMIRRLTDEDLRGVHLETLGAAAIARSTTPELLQSAVRNADPEREHAWLESRSFVEPLGGGLALHDLVRRAVLAELQRVEPDVARELRRRIADHLYERAARSGDLLLVIDLAYLAANPAFRWGFSWEAASRFRVDDPRPGDETTLSSLLGRTRHSAVWQGSRRFFVRTPEHVAVTRDGRDKLTGYSIAVTPGTAPAFADEDPILAPRLEHARRGAPADEAVIWRDSVDLTRDPASGVIGLLGMSGVLRSARANPQFGYLPINPALPGPREFAAVAGGRRVPELDAEVGGQTIECHLIDWGPGGLLAAQREFVYREVGLEPPPRPTSSGGLSVETVRDALRNLHVPSELTRNELAEGDTVEERAAHVRSRIADAAEFAFGDDASEQLLRSVLERGYLHPAASQEAAADELHLSRSAYFRRLKLASERIADYLSGEASSST